LYFTIMLTTLLRDLETRLALGLRADAGGVGLREATARILLAVDEDEAVAMTEIAHRVGRDPSTATRFVDRAAADDLLHRTPGARDRRRRLVRLTESGREARRRLLEGRRHHADAVVEAIREEMGLGRGQIEWFLQAFVRGLAGHVGTAS